MPRVRLVFHVQEHGRNIRCQRDQRHLHFYFYHSPRRSQAARRLVVDFIMNTLMEIMCKLPLTWPARDRCLIIKEYQSTHTFRRIMCRIIDGFIGIVCGLPSPDINNTEKLFRVCVVPSIFARRVITFVHVINGEKLVMTLSFFFYRLIIIMCLCSLKVSEPAFFGYSNKPQIYSRYRCITIRQK